MKRPSGKYFAIFSVLCLLQLYRSSYYQVGKSDDVVVDGANVASKSETANFHSDFCGCDRNVTVKMPIDSAAIHWCSAEASANGFYQDVVSYSLYGDSNSRYFKLMDVVPRQVAKFYKGWRMRVYHNVKQNTAEHKLLCQLYCNNTNVDICDVNELIAKLKAVKEKTKQVSVTGEEIEKLNERVWRYLPMMDPLVDHFMSRDLDSEICKREASAVNEWVQSNRTFHVMRDHQSHCSVIMAGLFGAKVYRRRDLIQGLTRIMLALGSNKGHVLDRDIDQMKLADIFWPSVKDDAVIHDSYCCERDWNSLPSQPFSTQRQNMTFVSGRSGGGWNALEKCPVKCRPPKHKNWEFC